MAGEDDVAFRVVVAGLVQGVGYRAFARRAALRLGVSGWVRNRFDGTVEALVAGAPARVEHLLAEMRRGPLGAEVSELRTTPVDLPPRVDDCAFVMRTTA